MLGKYVRVKITNPLNSLDSETQKVYKLNYGQVVSELAPRSPVKGAYIIGVNHCVSMFEGRVIATVKRKNEPGVILIVAPKSKKFIVHQIEDAIKRMENLDEIRLTCLYEFSCGAIVYRIIRNKVCFLLIKNKKSLNWGFPKGHMERGETEHQTAYREVLEETNVKVDFLPNFRYKSEYTIRDQVEKKVVIFLGTTKDTLTRIQRSEIDGYVWADYEKAMQLLKFPNDKFLLKRAYEYLEKNGNAKRDMVKLKEERIKAQKARALQKNAKHKKNKMKMSEKMKSAQAR